MQVIGEEHENPWWLSEASRRDSGDEADLLSIRHSLGGCEFDFHPAFACRYRSPTVAYLCQLAVMDSQLAQPGLLGEGV